VEIGESRLNALSDGARRFQNAMSSQPPIKER
jgi:hypothetical protein